MNLIYYLIPQCHSVQWILKKKQKQNKTKKKTLTDSTVFGYLTVTLRNSPQGGTPWSQSKHTELF